MLTLINKIPHQRSLIHSYIKKGLGQRILLMEHIQIGNEKRGGVGKHTKELKVVASHAWPMVCTTSEISKQPRRGTCVSVFFGGVADYLSSTHLWRRRIRAKSTFEFVLKYAKSGTREKQYQKRSQRP